MIIYFGFKGTLVDFEGNLRRYGEFVLRQLHQSGHRVFVVKSKDDGSVREELVRLGLDSYVEDVISGDGQGPKPDYVVDTDAARFQGNAAGYQVPCYNRYALFDDEELLEVYRQIQRITGEPGPPPRINVDDVKINGESS
jgi:hypothetical protein